MYKMKKIVLGILASIWLWFWTIFAQNILPDSAEITVADEVIMWEATNLKVTILKNESRMTSYLWTILMFVTEEDGTPLKENEFTLPSNGIYTFLSSDLWSKEFQRWLEIKKEWKFYVEVQDLNENEDKILWRKLIVVTRKKWEEDVKNIKVLNPIPSASLIGDKVEVIANCKEIPNSEATIYMDGNPVGTVNVATDGSIVYSIPNVVEWQHEIYIEIPNYQWEVLWKSDKVYFTISPYWNGGIKDVILDPPTGFMVNDMVNVTVMTDDMIESVKLRLSDRPENDSIVMSKNWIWEFSQNVFLIGTWEVTLSFDTKASNNVDQSYENLKTIQVADYPTISDLKVTEKKAEENRVDVWWNVQNWSIVSSYFVNYWDAKWTLSWSSRTETKAFRFNNVPHETVIYMNVTPYRNKNSKHWAASETITFVLSKDNKCWNWVCDEWETPETCPEDCGAVCWNWICEVSETPESCPEDCLWSMVVKSSCVAQTVPVRTTKIWDSYYLIWDKAKDVTKYIVYSSETQDIKNRTKIYETTDTSYEYPFDYNAKEDIYMYFWVVWVCENWEELELTGATKVKVWPVENLFLLICLTLLIYAWIKLFRQTEE